MKENPKGKIIMHEVRLVAKKFLQREGTKFDEVFALITRIETISLVINIANNKNGSIYQMDVKYGILNALLEEEEYMALPPGFVVKNQESMFNRLKKTLYGLKQAPRAWNKRIVDFLNEPGFDIYVYLNMVCL